MNTGQGAAALADEAHALCRQCERLAAELARVAGRQVARDDTGRGPGR